jgi:hypothetical protein
MSKTFKGGITATATMVALVAVLIVASLLVMGCASDSGNGDGGTGGIRDDGYTGIPIPAEIQTLAGALDWLITNAVDLGAYTVTVKVNETIQSRGLNYGDKRVNITLTGDAAGREVRLDGTGALFNIDRGVTLNVENLTLKGRRNSADAVNDSSLVEVNSGGILKLKAGAVITENYNYTGVGNGGSGGGVSVGENATFIMEGGTIRGNTSGRGGGVRIRNSSSFTKTGGIIYGDTDNIHTPGSTANTAVLGNDVGHAVWLTTPSGSLNEGQNSDAGEDRDMFWDGTTSVGFEFTTTSG